VLNDTNRCYFSNIDIVINHQNDQQQNDNGSSNWPCDNNLMHANCNGTRSTRYDSLVYDNIAFINKVAIKFMIMKIVFEQLTCYINPFITYYETSSHLLTYTSKQKIIEQNHIHHYSFYI
jgi:hypothetical protein